MPDRLEYTGQYANQPYRLMTEACDDIENLSVLTNRYHNLRNVWYGWACCPTTEKPPFNVSNSMTVLNDIWKNIGKLDKGTYLIAANSKRKLNIYRRRWLTKQNQFEVLESGYLLSTPYIVVQKHA